MKLNWRNNFNYLVSMPHTQGIHGACAILRFWEM